MDTFIDILQYLTPLNSITMLIFQNAQCFLNFFSIFNIPFDGCPILWEKCLEPKTKSIWLESKKNLNDFNLITRLKSLLPKSSNWIRSWQIIKIDADIGNNVSLVIWFEWCASSFNFPKVIYNHSTVKQLSFNLNTKVMLFHYRIYKKKKREHIHTHMNTTKVIEMYATEPLIPTSFMNLKTLK